MSIIATTKAIQTTYCFEPATVSKELSTQKKAGRACALAGMTSLAIGILTKNAPSTSRLGILGKASLPLAALSCIAAATLGVKPKITYSNPDIDALAAHIIRQAMEAPVEQFADYYQSAQDLLATELEKRGKKGEDFNPALQDSLTSALLAILTEKSLDQITPETVEQVTKRLQLFHTEPKTILVQAMKSKYGTEAIAPEIAAAADRKKNLEATLASLKNELKTLRGIDMGSAKEFAPLKGFTGSIDKVFKQKLHPANKAVEALVAEALKTLPRQELPQLLEQLGQTQPELKAKLETAIQAQTAAQAEYDALKKRYNELVGEHYGPSQPVAGLIGQVMQAINTRAQEDSARETFLKTFLE